MFLRSETYTNEYGIEMIKEYYGYYDESGNEVVTATIEEVKHIEPAEPEPSQLDRIEAQVNSIAENGTSWDSMAAAINEGVNEV